jgi:hypothetical protein
MRTSTRLWETAFYFVLAGAALAAGCDKGGSGNGAGIGGPTASACGEVVTAICNKTNECNATDIVVAYGSLDACISQVNRNCAQFDQWPGTSWTSDKLLTCAAAVRASSCPLDDTYNSDACKTAPGSLANGSACVDNSQCSGGRCNMTMSGDAGTVVPSIECGVCETRTSSTCGDAGTCVPPQRCEFTSTSGYACVTPAAEGSACGASQSCATGLTCRNMVCAKRLGESAPCAGFGDCDTSIGLGCIDGTCQMPPHASPGQSCKAPETRCTFGSNCIMTADGGAECISPAADNAPCDNFYGPRCIDPARCTNGTCTLPDYTQCR